VICGDVFGFVHQPSDKRDIDYNGRSDIGLSANDIDRLVEVQRLNSRRPTESIHVAGSNDMILPSPRVMLLPTPHQRKSKWVEVFPRLACWYQRLYYIAEDTSPLRSKQ
jgi:hypothetical protein